VADVLTQKVREAGRIENVAVVIATGVNALGNREVPGLDATKERASAPVFRA
jgi:putative transposase